MDISQSHSLYIFYRLKKNKIIKSWKNLKTILKNKILTNTL